MAAVKRWIPRWVAAGLVVALCHGATLAASEATDPTVQITQLNRDALAAIADREFEKARELLRRALDLCEKSGLGQHPVAARTHVHMGAVIIEGFKNRELGIKQLQQALTIEPGITLTPALVTPELTDAFDEAKARAGGGNPSPPANADEAGGSVPAPPPVDGSNASSSSGFTYHMVSDVKRGNPIRITVNVDDGLKFRKIVLAYRAEGDPTFLGREMEPVGGGGYSAEIPDRATTGPSVSYYIEAEGDDGQPVANRGTEERPLVIDLAAGRGAPPERGRATVEKHAGRDASDGEASEDAGPAWFAGLQIGSGVGYRSGSGGELNLNEPVSGAFSGALLGQLRPELGYWVRPDLLLSAQGRVQRVTGPTEIDVNGRVYSPEDWAFALFAKATWVFGSDSFRPFVSAGVGGGQIRHLVRFNNLTDCGPGRNQTCVDTVAAGPALAEGGVGFFYQLGSTLALELSADVAAAEPHFTVNLDLNAGLAVGF